MRKTGPRLHGFGVPLAALVATCFGASDNAFTLLMVYFSVMIGSLGAPDAFSRAASRLMSTRKVMGSLLIALLMMVPATVLLAKWFCVEMAAVGAMLVAARCFEELFASQGDDFSATITSLLTAILMAACLILTRDTVEPDVNAVTLTMQRAWPIAAGMIFAISGAIALGFSRKERLQLSPAIFKEIPTALVRSLLYPALIIGLLAVPVENPDVPDVSLYGICAGLILLELAKSTFKRDRFDSAGLKVGISVIVLAVSLAIAAVGCLWWNMRLTLELAMLLLAGAAAMLLYGPWDWEVVAAVLVMLSGAVLTVLGAFPSAYSFPTEILIGPAAGLALCLLMLRQWFELFRGARARRIRRKAVKRR